MVAVGGSGGRVRYVVVVRLRWLGASVSSRALGTRSGPGVLAVHCSSRDGVVGSTEWPIRATASARANSPHHYYDARPYDGAHHDACPFDAPRYDKDADSVSNCLAYGVPCGLAVSFSLTGSIEGDGGCCSIRRTRAGPLSASAGSGRGWVPDRGFSSFAPLFTKCLEHHSLKALRRPSCCYKCRASIGACSVFQP